jgi:hypothetical protein
LGDPWGLEKLTKDQKLDLLAYWNIQKEASTARWLQSRPATLRDVYDMLMMSRGKAPKSLFNEKPKAVDPSVVKQWAKGTGSNADAIRWWMS